MVASGDDAVTAYDALVAPDPAAWLALDEGERTHLVLAYHQREGANASRADAHAVAHTIIETQLAEGLPAARDALARLLSEGLDRHDAVHALAAVLMEHMSNLMNRRVPAGDPNAPYFAALEKLTAATWQRRT